MKKRIPFFLIVAIWVWLLNTCNPGRHKGLNWQTLDLKSLTDLRSEIDRLQNTPIMITGRVSYAFYTNVFGGGFYCLVDSAGTEALITTRHKVPPALDENVTTIVVPKVILKINNILGVANAELKRIEIKP